jgi:hypothetical protein
MARPGGQIRRAVTLTVLSMLVVAAVAAQAQAAELRFVHAAPGADPAVLLIDGEQGGSAVGFAEIGDYVRAPQERVVLSVRAAEGGKVLGGGTGTIGPGRHTAVAWLRDGKFELTVIDDAPGRSGRARLRAVHAAGELGRAAVRVDGRGLGEALSAGDATAYETLDPGSYELRVTRGGGGGTPLATKRDLRLSAGTSTTAFIFGSGGEAVRIVTAADSTAAPERAPATGLGGLGGDTPWLALALAALGAGVLGGGAYLLLARRRAA